MSVKFISDNFKISSFLFHSLSKNVILPLHFHYNDSNEKYTLTFSSYFITFIIKSNKKEKIKWILKDFQRKKWKQEIKK